MMTEISVKETVDMQCHSLSYFYFLHILIYFPIVCSLSTHLISCQHLKALLKFIPSKKLLFGSLALLKEETEVYM